ncbi:lysophospholipid acyltransferase LPEAT1-like isoform X2 [Hevea brasiliensis]|uniref:lysophospholipid acyltransferase LPEAT1-like isoform X2 n=1 Tax=Hevea brasiliensis TaxID=3981 RepID=UPI0025FBCD96|nr:lysophospholipid acyltransferase LPEAT1-like isoform X2 [Hevea brasiliensis]
METELKDENTERSKPCPQKSQPEVAPDDASTMDDLPLLKSDSNRMATENIQELEKKFAAFVRNDVYGTMGRGELQLAKKALLGFALVTLLPIRVMLAMIILFFYYAICRICTLFSAPNRDVEKEQEDFAHMGGWSRAVIVRSGRFLSRVMLFVFGFYWIRETYGILEQPKDKSFSQNEGKNQSGKPERPGAIISNHVSYLDILCHMSSCFPSFVAKWPNFLLLVSSGVVTERVREANQNTSAPMMMLFPEGTTTNGDFLLPFKTGAFLAGTPVLPVILRYPYQRFSPAWDSISGVRHVIFLLCQFINYIEVKRLPVYYPSQEEKDNPKLYAYNVRWLMAREGDLVMSDIGLAEKRVYHAALNGNNSLPSILHQKDD